MTNDISPIPENQQESTLDLIECTDITKKKGNQTQKRIYENNLSSKAFTKANSKREDDFDKLIPKTEGEKVVEELNKKHAALTLDQFYILTEKENSVFGGKDFSLESKQSFRNSYENKLIEVEKGRFKSKADIWLKSPDRREFKGIIFDPTTPGNINGYYNLWKGFNKLEKKGNCSKYWDHVKENICSNNLEAYIFVRKWLAYVLQYPDEVHTALVLCGSQGVGKNSFVEPIGVLLGSHYVLLSNISELITNFNYHLKHAVLIHANEALWGGNKKEIGALKAMITEKTCLIEGKGKDRIMVKNFKHVILSSNEDWPVHLDPDDRRFFVLRVSEAHKENHSYFEAIQKELDKGGYEALLYDLLNEDISSFNPRRFPSSNDAFDIKLRSSDSTHRYIYNILYEGCFDVGNSSPDGSWQDISIEGAYSDYGSWCMKNKENQIGKDLFSKKLQKLIPSITGTRPTENGMRIRKYRVPSLNIARTEFEKAYKVTGNIWNE